jgi:hypothetical protein
MLAATMQNSSRMEPRILALAVPGIALIMIAAFNLYRACHGADLAQLYLESKMLLADRPMYTPGEMRAAALTFVPEALTWYEDNPKLFYPPSSGILTLPLAAFSFPIARTIAFWLSLLVMLAGVWTLMRVFLPRWNVAARVWMLALLLFSITVRWGMEQLQAAPLVLGLLGFFLTALAQERPRTLFVCGAVVLCLKVSLCVPFLVLALWRRQFRVVGAILGVGLLLNGVGFVRVGGLSAVQGYRANLAQIEALPVNHPDPRFPESTERTDWPYLFNGIAPDIPRSRTLSMLLTLAVAAYLLREAFRSRQYAHAPEALAAMTAPVVCLSLLGSYHHAYDASLLFAPLLLYWAQGMRGLRAAFIFLVLYYASIRPLFRETASLLAKVFHTDALVIERVAGVFLLTVCLVLTLILLRRTVGGQEVTAASGEGEGGGLEWR